MITLQHYMTPARLREDADEISDSVQKTYVLRMMSAAAAWEAEVQAWKDAYAERDRAYNVLLARNKALERAMMDAEIMLRQMLGLTSQDEALEQVIARLAALREAQHE